MLNSTSSQGLFNLFIPPWETSLTHPLYVSLSPLLYCATLIIVTLNKAKKRKPPPPSSARRSLTDESIVGVLVFAAEKATCLCCRGHNRRILLQPAVLVSKLERKRRKRCTFRVFIGLSGRLIKKKRAGGHKMIKQNKRQELGFQGR